MTNRANTTASDADHALRIGPNLRRIRGTWRGRTVVDTTDSVFVWEHRYYPTWYFPLADIHGDLVANGDTFTSSRCGLGTRFDLVVDGTTIADAAYRHLDSPSGELRDMVRIEWNALDSWFEEDVEVFLHPRSPEVRVDVLSSSRHVRVLVDGAVVADSVRSRILFETGNKPRFYLPKTDVRMDLLTPTDTETVCPYKGWASYWSVTVGDTTHDDIAWGYRTPLPESRDMAGMVCFYNERVELEVDGQRWGT